MVRLHFGEMGKKKTRPFSLVSQTKGTLDRLIAGYNRYNAVSMDSFALSLVSINFLLSKVTCSLK